MIQTTNYGLAKPQADDNYDINVFNSNADMIDQQLKATEVAAANAATSAFTAQTTAENAALVSIPLTQRGEPGGVAELDSSGLVPVQQLPPCSMALSEDITIYVATNGNDNGNGTVGSPYASVTKALRVIPKNLNGHTATINIAMGTYNEVVTVNGYSGGIIYIVPSGNLTFTGINITSSFVRVQNIACTITTGCLHTTLNATWISSGSTTIIVNGGIVNQITTLDEGILAWGRSFVYASGAVTVNNTTGNAVYAVAGSDIMIGTLAGTGNSGTGVRLVNQATITYTTNTMTATTPTYNQGGMTYRWGGGDSQSVATTPTAILAGTNLNTITATGFYVFQNNMVNGPSDNIDWSTMIVVCNTDVIQQTIISPYTGNTYTRGGYGMSGTPTWSPWRKNYDSGSFGEGTNYCGLDPNNTGKINPARASATIRGYNTNITLSIGDAGTFVQMYGGSPQTVTIPPNSSVAFPIGAEIEIIRHSSAAVTIATGAGVTILCSETARTIAKQYQSVCLKKQDTDAWYLQGALG